MQRNSQELSRTVFRNGWLFRFAPDFPADRIPGFPESIDSVLAAGTKLKDSRTTTAALCSVNGLPPFFLKRTNNKSVGFTLRYLFRRARAFRAAETIRALREAEIDTPAVLAVGEHRRGMLLCGGYIVNEMRSEVRDMHALLVESPDPPRTLDTIMEKAAELLSRIHNHNIVHGDYKLSNIYLTPDGRPGTWDLDGGLVLRAPHRKKMLEDLFRLTESCRRVLRLAHPGCVPSDLELCRKAAECYSGPFSFFPEEIRDALERKTR